MSEIHEPKVESADTKGTNVERSAAAVESAKLLNTLHSLPVLHQGTAQKADDQIQPLALTYHGKEVPATAHLLHHAGHGHGRHHTGDAPDQAAAASDTVAQKQGLATEALNDPALMAILAKQDPGLAAQMAAQNPAMALQLAKDNPGLAVQLASQNSALAAQLAAQNPALAAQLVAQGLIAKTQA